MKLVVTPFLFALFLFFSTQVAWAQFQEKNIFIFTPAFLAAACSNSVTGYWNVHPVVNGRKLDQYWKLEDSNGEISGQFKCDHTENLTGQRVERQIILVFYNQQVKVTMIGTIGDNEMSGTWASIDGKSGTWSAVKIDDLPCE
jgi:hypothetical protein